MPRVKADLFDKTLLTSPVPTDPKDKRKFADILTVAAASIAGELEKAQKTIEKLAPDAQAIDKKLDEVWGFKN